MSGTWHDTRGYPPRPFPYRDSSPSGNTTKIANQNGYKHNQGPSSPGHAVLGSVPSNASSVYVVDGSEQMNRVKGSSSSKKTNGSQYSCTILKIFLVVVFWILIAALIGGIIYFVLTLIDNSNDPEPTESPALQRFAGTFTLPVAEFSTALSHESSDEYQQLYMEVTESLDELYSRSSESENYVRSDVVGFSEGSVIVEYLLYFHAPSSAVEDASTTPGSVMTIFQNAVNEAQEGEASLFGDVDPGSIVIEEVLDRHESTTVPLNIVKPSTPDEESTTMTQRFFSSIHTTRFLDTTTLTQTMSSTQPELTPSDTTGRPVLESTTMTQRFFNSIHTTRFLDPTTLTQTMSSTQPELTPSDTTGRPVLECGTRMMERTQRIIGGGETQRGNWPWLVSLQSRYGHYCGAAIIGNIWILTAAHCTYDRSVEGIYVFLNSTIIGHEDGYYAQLDEIYMHPDYNDDTLDYDIALLRLRRSLVYSDTVSPICLETIETDNIIYDECYIAGWGNTDSDVLVDSGSDVLLEAKVPVIPRTVCDTYIDAVTDQMICAGYVEGGIDSCSGDSGGPLMCPSNDGNWYVSGVTSWGIGCAQPENPGVYANVPILTSWVFSTMQYWYETQVNTTVTDSCTEITESTCLDVLPYNMMVDFTQIYNGEYSDYEDITPTTDQLSALAACHPNALLFICSYIFRECPVETASSLCQQFCYEVTSACVEELNDIYIDFYVKCDIYPLSESGSDTLFCEPPTE